MNDELQLQKQDLYERSAAQGEISDLGTLTAAEYAHLWNDQGISRQNRVSSGEITDDEVEAAVAEIGRYYVAVTAGASKRCIDGSTLEGYDDTDTQNFARPLGPQVQGGSADEAVARRLVKITRDPAEATTSTLAEDIINLPTERPSSFTEGDHTDDHADADSHPIGTKTGCGAVDGQPRKFPRYSNPDTAPLIKSTADVIFGLSGKTPPEGMYEQLTEAASQLAANEAYMSAPHDVLAAIRQVNPDGVEKLKRPHAEVALVLNMVPGTTLHRDHFNARTESKIQSFGLDVWNIIAENDEATAYAIIVDAVATAMDLTDGSLRLLARMPR